VTNRILTSVLLTAGFGLTALAQSGAPPAKFIPAGDVSKQIDAAKPALGIVAGQTATIVPNLIVRRRVAGPNNASVHSAQTDKQDVTEVYQIIDGSGTFVTGGRIRDPKDRTAGIEGGESRDVKPGDFIVIPPGTPHWFSKINGHVTFVETRFPGNVVK
jgi:mannose-6-phosphate isomerase-like protein (cupin superfamily)